MNIDFEDLADAIRQTELMILSELPDLVQISALDLKAKIQDRIQETGTKANGSSFEDYSEKYERQKSKRYGTQSTIFTNLTATGNMFREMQIVGSEETPQIVSVIIGGRTQDAQDKINWNSERYGDILLASDSEINQVAEDFDNSIQRIIDNSPLA